MHYSVSLLNAVFAVRSGAAFLKTENRIGGVLCVQHDEYVSLNEPTPRNHTNYHIPQRTGRGGGRGGVALTNY